jgi:hypothetical protein
MAINNSQVPLFGTELSVAMTGSAVLIGTLPNPATHIVFDNQSTSSVGLYVNGTAAANLWRTFTAGEAIVLDLRAAAAAAPNFSANQNTTFYGLGAATGNFSISYIFAQNM